jgi:hypothetical protein
MRQSEFLPCDRKVNRTRSLVLLAYWTELSRGLFILSRHSESLEKHNSTG